MNQIEPSPIKEYYIAYFDVLGYKEFFRNSPEKATEFLQIISNLIGRTSEWVETVNTSPILKNIGRINIQTKIFSDNVLLCLEKHESPLDSLRLLILLKVVAEIQKESINKLELFIRGGITVGEMSFNEKYVFGQGLIEAVELENQAIYPRIVISEHIIDMLISTSEALNCSIDKSKDIKNIIKDSADDVEKVKEQLDNYMFSVIKPAYDRMVCSLVMRWFDNKGILSYLQSFRPSNKYEEEIAANAAAFVQKYSPEDFDKFSPQNEDFEDLLHEHKRIVEKQLTKYGKAIEPNDEKAEVIREKILKKYIWVMAYHNRICSINAKEDCTIQSRLNCDASYLRMNLELL